MDFMPNISEGVEEKVRFFEPEQIRLFYASFLDNYHIRKLSETLVDTTEYFIDSRQASSLKPELNLLSRLCYYLPALLTYQATPGQAFCSLKPVGYVEAKDQKKVAIFPDTQRLVYLSLSYALLPYLYERRDDIYQNLLETYKVLREEEVDIEFPEDLPSEQLELTEEITEEKQYVSFVQVLSHAFATCWQHHIAVDNTTRLTRIISFFYDIHVLFYLVYQKYWEVPMRCCALQVVTTRKPSIQAKLDTLTYIAKFQLIFQIYYMCRIFFHEIDQSSAHLTTQLKLGTEEKFPSTVEENRVESEHSTGRTCVLCLDLISHPAVIPCGHIFCWSCILSYTNRQKIQRRNQEEEKEDEVGRGLVCKCPVCRNEFTKFKIRALHAYF